MAKKRRDEGAPAAQARFAWADAARILDAAPAGEVMFEAADLRRAPTPTPRRPSVPAKTLGLPFGVREVDGQPACWSCGRVIVEAEVVRAGPGDSRCPGCGAKLPFVP